MDARTFLALQQTEDPLRWRLPVTAGLCTPGKFLFGGCGLAAGVEILEEITDRPLVWATAQYLSYAPLGSMVEWEVIPAVQGHQVSQARAVGRLDGTEILTVNAALGRRRLEIEEAWAQRPVVPSPAQCAPRLLPGLFAGTVLERIEVRLADGRQMDQLARTGSAPVPGTGRSAVWARLLDVVDNSSAALSIFGDMVPSGIAQALGRPAGGSSLDNTIRVARLVPTEWVLVDVRIHAIHAGFAHGLAHLWAENGVLLGTASQSMIVRFWESAGGFPRLGAAPTSSSP